MNLKDIHEKEGRKALVRLADLVGCNPKYLEQLARGSRFPSPTLAFKLIAAEPRLKFESLYEAANVNSVEVLNSDH
jgi:hypothetical protein